MPSDHDAYIRAFRRVVNRLGCRRCALVDELALEADSLVCHGPREIWVHPTTGACLAAQPTYPKGGPKARPPWKRNVPPQGALVYLRSKHHQ